MRKVRSDEAGKAGKAQRGVERVKQLQLQGPAQWTVVLMAQNRHSKSLTLGGVHAARLCGEDALLDVAPTPGNRCTC